MEKENKKQKKVSENHKIQRILGLQNQKIFLEMEKHSCADKDCPLHGELKARGREFEGYVIKKFPRRIAIEFERTIYIRKYERYMKKKTKLHARLPDCMKEKINVGDYVLIKECRPLSKIIHFVLIKVLRKTEK